MVVLALKNTKFSGLHDNFVRFVSLQLIEILGALKKKKVNGVMCPYRAI